MASKTWSPGLVELPQEAPSVPTHTRTGSAKAGAQNGRVVPCAKKPDAHGFHPENEACPYCVPAPRDWTWVSREPPARDWYVDVSCGILVDANLHPFVVSNFSQYVPLKLVAPDSPTAKKMCGCYYGIPCRSRRLAGVLYSGSPVHSHPQRDGDPAYEDGV